MADEKRYRNWRVERDGDGIARLWFDKEGASTNVLSKEVLEELDACLQELETDRPRGLIVASAKKNGFIAGADINEFVPLSDYDSALALIRRGQAVFKRLEALPFATVAAVHGFCLGGGLELALACRYRVAANDADTKLGLPEIMLGIHPGFGGTVRATHLIGGLAGLEMMLTGRPMDARKALKAGLIDLSVPMRHLQNGARKMIDRPPSKKGRPDWKRVADLGLIRPYAADMVRKKTARKAAPKHYPAPNALIGLWEKYYGDRDRMMEEEAKSVARLLTGETAQNIIRVFFLQDRLKAIGKKEQQRIDRVHVIGAGIMGGDIAAWSALRGCRVTLQDRAAKFVAPAINRAYGLLKGKLKSDRLVQGTMDLLTPDVRGNGAAKADLIIEAVFEDLNVKRELFGALEEKAMPDAVLATNTSSIPLEQIAQSLKRPERLVGIHFFNPVAKMQLVEVVRGDTTAQDTFDKALSYVRQIGKLPLPVKSRPGFLVNRILMPYLMEAVVMASEGIPVKVIDRAATSFGMPMGPLRLADTVGLDICLHVVKIFSEYTEIDIPARLTEMVEKGKLGKKSGAGFYDYRSGKKEDGEEDIGVVPPDVTDRLIYRLLNEAAACLREGIVEDADLLDAGIIFGTGFAPFRGGPMHYASGVGYVPIVDRLNALEQSYGPRFRADEGWKDIPPKKA